MGRGRNFRAKFGDKLCRKKVTGMPKVGAERAAEGSRGPRMDTNCSSAWERLANAETIN